MKKKLLLCIDDDFSGLKIRRLFLESQGYEVLIANRVSEGLRLFENEDIDAVVLDYYMPEMNGDHVAEMMKRHRPDVPIVMLSAFVTVPQNVTANTDAFVVKGDAPKKLLNTIDQLLNKAA